MFKFFSILPILSSISDLFIEENEEFTVHSSKTETITTTQVPTIIITTTPPIHTLPTETTWLNSITIICSIHIIQQQNRHDPVHFHNVYILLHV